MRYARFIIGALYFKLVSDRIPSKYLRGIEPSLLFYVRNSDAAIKRRYALRGKELGAKRERTGKTIRVFGL